MDTGTTADNNFDEKAILMAVHTLNAAMKNKQLISKFVVGRNNLRALRQAVDPLNLESPLLHVGMQPLWGIPVIEHPDLPDYPLVPLDQHGFPIVDQKPKQG